MKKISLLSVLISLFTLSYAQYQDQDIVIKGSNSISMQSTPKQIIDSLHKRFPNAQAVKYYKTSPATVKAGWEVEHDDQLSSDEDVDTYTLSFKRSDFQYYALYDAKGNLLMSKYEEYDTKLPAPVEATIKSLAADKYKDYKLHSKTHFKQENYGKSKNYYKIVGVSKTNSKDKKTITIAPDGTVIKAD